jgi:hypothetical protein
MRSFARTFQRDRATPSSAGFTRLAERQALFNGERCTEFVYVCHRSAA